MAPKTVLTKPPSRPSHIYVLSGLVTGRPTRPPAHTEALVMLREYEPEIKADIPDLWDRLQAYEAVIDRRLVREWAWVHDFRMAYSAKEDLPTMRKGVFVGWGNTSAMTGPQLALWSVLRAGHDGVTVWEAKTQTGRMSHAVSGGMTRLHQAGTVACLKARR